NTFEFETIEVDVYGSVTFRQNREGRHFIEKLASEVTLEMVEIPEGSFTMGSPKAEQGSSYDERPQREVTISPFHIGKFAVTQAQWRVVAGWPEAGRELNPDPSRFKGDARPVENVSWEDAVEFCARLSRETRKLYRLPTEAEWEYACRAGTTTPFAFGETITPAIANYDGNFPYGDVPKGEVREGTIAAGILGLANEFGLYDMHGNVWEWCQDRYGPYEAGTAIDPLGPSSGRRRVLRGGSWNSFADGCRSACRINYVPGFRYLNFGFRVVVISRTH
ncbi:MAG TPA: formylglycine-generating enzyme family protein, partial [Blastocatellia bacterium]|nr:formylglycine-generating enzyme family protein [Blastocatellia bacterium]